MTGTMLDMREEVRQFNISKGWFDTERPFPADVALLHSEVTEAYEAYIRSGVSVNDVDLMDLGTKYDPDAVGAELADIFIRLLDTCGRYDIEFALIDDDIQLFDKPDFVLCLMAVHRDISRMFEHYRKSDTVGLQSYVLAIYFRLYYLCLSYSVDLLGEYTMKMMYNRDRPYRHGGKIV